VAQKHRSRAKIVNLRELRKLLPSLEKKVFNKRTCASVSKITDGRIEVTVADVDYYMKKKKKSVNVALIVKTGKWKLLRLYADDQTLSFGSEIDLQKLFY
jgi:hypothetical protein